MTVAKYSNLDQNGKCFHSKRSPRIYFRSGLFSSFHSSSVSFVANTPDTLGSEAVWEFLFRYLHRFSRVSCFLPLRS